MKRKHEAVKLSVSENVNGQARTNGLESFWASLKRSYHGIFHHFSEKHLHRYVSEFAGRHNIGGMDTIVMMKFLAKGMVDKRLTYAELIEKAG